MPTRARDPYLTIFKKHSTARGRQRDLPRVTHKQETRGKFSLFIERFLAVFDNIPACHCFNWWQADSLPITGFFSHSIPPKALYLSTGRPAADQPYAMGDNDLDTSVLTKEIIGTTPSWIIQWGITLIFLVFIGLGLALTLIKYPVSRHLEALITYEAQPLAITVPEKSMVTAVYVNDTGFVTKDQAVMALENESTRQYVLKAPVTGRLFLTDRWQNNAFVHTGQTLGFILPAIDKRILRLRMATDDVVHLQKGQKVVIRLDRSSGIDRPLPGYIDFIGPAFPNQGYFSVTIKFRNSEQAYLSSMPFPYAADTLHCNVSITIDTTTVLNHFFRRARN